MLSSNSLGELLHGIEETKGEDTDNLVLEVLNDDVGLNMSKTALDHSDRIGNPKSKKSHNQSSLNLYNIMTEGTYF